MTAAATTGTTAGPHDGPEDRAGATGADVDTRDDTRADTDRDADAPPPERERSERSWPWGLATAVVAVLTALVPLRADSRWYFIDDSATGAYGVWYHLGSELRAGNWPLLDPSRWTSGNFVAEGQWGLWNPFVMLIGLGATVFGNVVLYATLVKIVGLLIAAGGTYLLARGYGARPAWAFLAGGAVPFGGFTVYFDAASWVTGLLTFALLPWCWWGVRRTLVHGRNPLPGLVAIYLFVTIGYVYAVVVLAVLILVLAPAGWHGGVTSKLRARLSWLGFGAVALALVLTTFLPQLLSAGVTVRDTSGVINTFFLRATVSGLFSGIVPTSTPSMIGFWQGPVADAPLAYLLWFLPVVAFVAWRTIGREARPLLEPLAVGLVAAALTVGPSFVGPFRHFISYAPYLGLALGVGVVALLSRYAPARPSFARLVVAAVVTLSAFWISYSDTPPALRRLAVATVLVLVGLALVWLALRVRATVVRVAAAGAAGLLVIAVVAVQVHYFPRSSLTSFDLPDTVEEYQSQLAGAEGDTLVVGAPTANLRGEATWDDTLVGNAWYLNPHPVANEYTTIAFTDFVRQLCMGFRGETCPELLGTLFQVDPTTGLSIADAMSLSSVQVLDSANPQGIVPPVGWSVKERTSAAQLWVRDTPLPRAGGVVATSDGTDVQEVRRDDRSVTLRVGAVGPDGGTVTFSRLAWPGYTTTAGTLGEAGNDWSLQLRLPASAAGREVTVAFSPPGWTLARAAWVAAIVLGVLLSAFPLLTRARRRRPATTPETT